MLFARRDSYYKRLPGVEVYDADRDALTWPGGGPVVAHPPCRAWAGLRHMARPAPGEREYALWAVEQVRFWGGVLEHPATSTLWRVAGLPEPGQGQDEHGGWTMLVDQHWWGHMARKRTRLYICGCVPEYVPEYPMVLGDAPCLCGTPGRRRDGSRLRPGDPGYRPEIPRSAREQTPPLFGDWLITLAARCAR